MLKISHRATLDQWQWEHVTLYRFPWGLVLVLRGTQLPTPARRYTRGTCRDWGIVPTYSHHIGSKNLRISRLMVLSSECECECEEEEGESGGCRGLYVAVVRGS